ncbi:MAG: radical SAM protein [Methanothrix sp.]|nr:radical SAM protein [Methanothrix sp.]
MILRPFDPWKCQLCTCPPKMSLNPYTGCPHGCLYCYASSYIPHFQECRAKADLLRRLEREAKKINPNTLVAMSNSSDPYPAMEKELELSRGCLQILLEKNLPVQVITKSDLVIRDADLLSSMKSTVAISITTLSESISRKLEPGAPSPSRRLMAIRRLTECNIPVSARIDPIIPGINESEIEELVLAVCRAGAAHIVSSTYKARKDNLRRVCSAFPRAGDALKVMFQRGSRIYGSLYLSLDMRMGLMREVEKSALREGVTFSACREGIAPPDGINCDGTHLILCKNRA